MKKKIICFVNKLMLYCKKVKIFAYGHVNAEGAAYVGNKHATGDIGYAGNEDNFIPYSY